MPFQAWRTQRGPAFAWRTPRFHPGVGHDDGPHVSETATAPAGKSASGLSGMLLPELKQLAQSLGITGASTMR